MSHSILVISSLTGAQDCADILARQLGMQVEVAATRKAGLAALRAREYKVVIVEDSLAEGDPAGADLVWKHSRLAVPLQINFALSSSSRLVRDVRAALARRAQEHALALRSASTALECELKSAITGLLLQSQLALADSTLNPKLAARLKMIHELANTLRHRLVQGLEPPEA